MNSTLPTNFRKYFISFLIIGFFGISVLHAQNYSQLIARIDTAVSLQSQEHFNESTALLNSISDQINDSLPAKIRFDYYQNLAYNLFVVWELEKAEYAAKSSINVAEFTGDTAMLAKSYNLLGNIYSKQERSKQSVYYLEKSLKMIGPGDSVNYYGILINITNSLSLPDDNSQALSNLIRAKRFYQRKNIPEYVSTIENNLGELYRSGFKEYSKAIAHYRLAQRINIENNFTQNLTQNYHNLALTFLEMDKIDSALSNIQAAIRLRKSIGDEAGMAHGYNLMGDVYFKMNKFDRAHESYNTMLRISKKNGIDPGIYYANIGLAQTAVARKEYSDALNYFNEAKISADLMNSGDINKDIAKHLYLFYKSQRNYKKALESHENLVRLDSVVKTVQDQEAMDELKIKYENKLALSENEMLKAREQSRIEELASQKSALIFLGIGLGVVLILVIILLRINTQRKKAYDELEFAKLKLENQYATSKSQQQKLQQANSLKNLIFSVIGHDLREPLAALSQILNLVNSGDLTKDEMEVLLYHIQGQTDKNLKSLQDILLWARAQSEDGSINKIEFDGADIVEEVIQKYQELIENKGIKVERDLENGVSVWADINQFRSICQNLLSNAIKFTPSGKTITVSLFDTDSLHIFRVSDNGDGISENLIQRILAGEGDLVSSRGTEGETGTGIGLRLVREFTNANGGNLRFENAPNGGTVVVVELPRNDSEMQMSDSADDAGAVPYS